MQPFRRGVVPKRLDDLLSADVAVECSVTMKCTMRRRAMPKHGQHEGTRPVSVGTVKKSIAAAVAR